MARENLIWNVSLIANADYSTNQYQAVTINSSGNAALAGAGVKAVGVLQNKPKSGESAAVMVLGETKWKVGSGGVTKGDRAMTDGTGQVITWTTGSYDLGWVRDTAAAGTITTVILLPGGKT